MTEVYLFYSSLTLLAMGCLTLALSVLFRLKSHAINSLPKKVTPDVFDKTFVVFNPYPEHRKIIHNFLFVLPILVFAACLGLTLIAWKIFEYGFVSSLFVLIICLNFTMLEVAPETYQNTRMLIKAVQRGTSLGVGDLRALQTVKKALPKLSKYYLGLAILFLTFAATIDYVLPSTLWLLGQLFGLMLGVSAATGFIGWQIAILLFTLVVVVVQILVGKLKARFLSYVTD
jgi:hypothetical protein